MASRKTGYLIIFALVLLIAATVVDIFLNGRLAIDWLILLFYAAFRWIIPIVMCLQLILFAFKNWRIFAVIGSRLTGSLRMECFMSGVYTIAVSAIMYFLETSYLSFLLSGATDMLLVLIVMGIGVLAGFIMIISAMFAEWTASRGRGVSVTG